jgi:hypothetical protein
LSTLYAPVVFFDNRENAYLRIRSSPYANTCWQSLSGDAPVALTDSKP